MDPGMHSSSASVKSKFYSQYGAPSLLYRNEECYTSMDIAPQSIVSDKRWRKTRALFRRNRAQARWYFPIDQSLHEFNAPSFTYKKRKRKRDPTISWEETVMEILQKHAPALLFQDDDNNKDTEMSETTVQLVELLKDADSYTNREDLELTVSHFLNDDIAHVAKEIILDLQPMALAKQKEDSQEQEEVVVADEAGSKDDSEEEEEAKSKEDDNEEDDEEEEGNEIEEVEDVEGLEQEEVDQEEESVEEEQIADKGEKGVTRKKSRRNRKFHSHRLFTPAYLDQQCFPLQRHARRRLLQENQIPPSHVDHVVKTFEKYDLTYMPAVPRTKDGRYTLGTNFLNKTRAAVHQRLLNADPAYMAPPFLGSIREATQDMTLKPSPNSTIDEKSRNRESEKVPYEIEESLYQCMGTNILCFPCFCRSCTSKQRPDLSPNWWLLHPTGAMLNRVSLSPIQLPNGRPLIQEHVGPGRPTNSFLHTIDLDERVWQLVKCGTHQYVARTCANCTVFEVRQQPKSKSEYAEDKCQGVTLYLQEIHHIDFRLDGGLLPRYVTAHPKYGNLMTDSKLAVVACSRTSFDVECNVIKHVAVGSEELRISHHHITNLQDIRQIDFSKHHPMVLWSTARSYIRPKPQRDPFQETPLFGHGHSLYSIDLRCNKASFQWSPSGQEHLVEGVHSLSGIMTMWAQEHGLLVSSLSAKKTWELDTRMPCQVVNTWSLPHHCEGIGARRPVSSVHGSGFLFSLAQSNRNKTIPSPIFGINCTPGSFGLHLYQQPNEKAQLYTDSVECFNVSDDKDTSIVASSSFPLPDVANDVYTCGLSAFQMESRVLDSNLSDSHPDALSALCVVTATNKGDVYAHCLLQSQSAIRDSVSSNKLPIGTSATPIRSVEAESLKLKMHERSLVLKLSNEFPAPSSAIMKTSDTVGGYRGGVRSYCPSYNGRCGDETLSVNSFGANAMSLIQHGVSGESEASREENMVRLGNKLIDKVNEAQSTMECFHDAQESTPSLGRTSDINMELLVGLNENWDEYD